MPDTEEVKKTLEDGKKALVLSGGSFDDTATGKFTGGTQPAPSVQEYFDGKKYVYDALEGKDKLTVMFGSSPTPEYMLRDFDDHKYHRTLLQDSFRHDAIHGYLEIIQPIINQWVENLKKGQKLFKKTVLEVWNLF